MPGCSTLGHYTRRVPYLFYWTPKLYYRHLDDGVGYHLNQGNPIFASVPVGDSVWAFTRNRAGRHVIAAEIVCHAVATNPPDYTLGKYRVWGDLERSRYFEIEGQPDAIDLLGQASGRTSARIFTRAFQGHAAVLAIDENAHRLLARWCDGLPLEPRATLAPEDVIERAAFEGDTGMLADALDRTAKGMSPQRRAYLVREAPARCRALVEELRSLYAGRCQLCGWDPVDEYGRHLAEAHHIHWLSRGGADDLSNMLLVCPNHHRAIHACDAVLDWASMRVVFGEGLTMAVREGSHLHGAARATCQ